MALGRDPRQGRQGPESPKAETTRAWKGLNLTDSRLSIDDDELYRCENAMPLGRGIAPTPLYNGPAGVSLHNSLIKESFGCSLTYGGNAEPHPCTITVWEDGSAYMRDHFLDGAIDSQIAPPGTFSASPKGTAITIWQDGPVLFLDDVAGYCKWDGTTFSVIDASKKGHGLAVFSGYTFLLLAPRSFTYTAPNTFDDFTAGDGSGSFKITDDAFTGSVQRLISTVSQLWIVGVSAIDALGNIQTSSGITTFSITNAVSTLGTAFGDSVIGYYRSLVFSTGYSIHSLLGVTPQKLSGKIDRIFSSLTPAIAFGPRPGVVELNGVLVLMYLFSFTDPQSGAVSTKLLCFAEGKWFLADTPDLNGNRVLDMVTLTIRTTVELYGIDAGGFLYRIFARPTDPMQGTVIVASKLSDGGSPIQGRQAFKVGFDLSSPLATNSTRLRVTLTSEAVRVRDPFFTAPFCADADSWLGLRYAMPRFSARISGQRLGWTLNYPCADLVTLEAAHLEAAPDADWEEPLRTSAGSGPGPGPGPTPTVFVFTNPDGSEFVFENPDATPYVFENV